MLKKLIFIMLLTTISLSSSDWLERRYNALIKPYSNYTLEEYKHELNYWSSRIQDNVYKHVLVDNAIMQNVPIEYIYSIAYTETGNFRYMKSLKPNKNGSIDYGIMAINSYNLSNNRFMETHFYDEYFTTFRINNQFHIARVGVRYFKHLLERTNEDLEGALKSYNCGYNAWVNNRVPSMTYEYAYKINKMIDVTTEERQYYFGNILLTKLNNIVIKYGVNSIDEHNNILTNMNIYEHNNLYSRRYLIVIGTDIYIIY